MPFTYTGRSVKPGTNAYPSLVDIAVGISRAARFAGQGQRWFSVLDHTLFADEIVKSLPESGVPYVLGGDLDEARKHWRLAVLLHDAHEAVTADVPTTFKGVELKQAQRRLDELIGGAFYPGGSEYFLHPNVVNSVKWIDRRALAAEARVIGPPAAPERLLETFGVTDDTPQDIERLRDLLRSESVYADDGWFAMPPTAYNPDDHPGVKEYLRRVLELI